MSFNRVNENGNTWIAKSANSIALLAVVHSVAQQVYVEVLLSASDIHRGATNQALCSATNFKNFSYVYTLLKELL